MFSHTKYKSAILQTDKSMRQQITTNVVEVKLNRGNEDTCDVWFWSITWSGFLLSVSSYVLRTSGPMSRLSRAQCGSRCLIKQICSLMCVSGGRFPSLCLLEYIYYLKNITLHTTRVFSTSRKGYLTKGWGRGKRTRFALCFPNQLGGQGPSAGEDSVRSSGRYEWAF